MPSLFELPEFLQMLIDRGGSVLVAIFCLSVLLWVLILERYWYLYRVYPHRLRQAVEDWRRRDEHHSWYSHRIREGMLSELSVDLQRFLTPIDAIVTVLPLLGLLGTVTGMVSTFESMTVLGTGSARGLAAGISEALLVTIAGLTTAIIGLYCSVHLQSRVQTARQLAVDQLTLEESPGGADQAENV